MRKKLSSIIGYTACLSLAACLLVNVGCKTGNDDANNEVPKKATENNLPDIILISIDTLRADHLGCYGHESVENSEH